MRVVFCLFFFTLAAGLTLAQAPVAPKPQGKEGEKDKDKAKDKPKGDKPTKLAPSPLDKVEGYNRKIVEGFTVMFSKEADEADGKDMETKPKEALVQELQSLKKILAPKYFDMLQKSPLWVDWDEYEPLKSGREGRATASFEVSAPQALAQAKKNPYQSKCIVVHSLKIVTETHQPKADPNAIVMLRAVARAVYDQVLGMNYSPLALAYRNALEHKLYDRAQNVTTSEGEFFAELTCAYFDQLQHYPKTRDELKKHDPSSHAMLEPIWGGAKKPTKPTPVPMTTQGAPATPVKVKTLADFNGSDKYDLSIGHAAIMWGATAHGPEFKIEDAKESIIVLASFGGDEWIILEKLTKMNDELSPYGVKVVVAPSPAADAEDVKKKLGDRDIEYTGLDKALVKVKDEDFQPEKPGQAIIFNAEGKCVFRGIGYEALPHARAALAKKILAKAMPGEAPKAMAAFAEAFSQGQLSMADAIPKVAALTASGDPDTASIAKAIHAELLAPAVALLAEVQSQVKTDPFTAFQVAEKLTQRYKGSSASAKAAALLEQLKQNPAVALELKARVMFDPIKKLDALLMVQPGSYSTLDDRFQKPNAVPISQLVALNAALKKKYPMAKATADAAKIVAKYSLLGE